ncbi:hypothetical protein BKA67DRAFT_583622 [Truncatella angustata]|uniref:Uncharacterized protein n=1 Tax=Truncatella angustata TaxID=152316 RepID=A0A9P8UCH7_9PEZI|nr:uncharacterized protein BKA67DRAFT_583622 [Truncatella angustata]KAH6646235.1 hypothetical protein BKA67DRAFT_583622 [Truncatella angustata]
MPKTLNFAALRYVCQPSQPWLILRGRGSMRCDCYKVRCPRSPRCIHAASTRRGSTFPTMLPCRKVVSCPTGHRMSHMLPVSLLFSSDRGWIGRHTPHGHGNDRLLLPPTQRAVPPLDNMWVLHSKQDTPSHNVSFKCGKEMSHGTVYISVVIFPHIGIEYQLLFHFSYTTQACQFSVEVQHQSQTWSLTLLDSWTQPQLSRRTWSSNLSSNSPITLHVHTVTGPSLTATNAHIVTKPNDHKRPHHCEQGCYLDDRDYFYIL